MRPADFMQLFSDPMGFCMCNLVIIVPLVVFGLLKDWSGKGGE